MITKEELKFMLYSGIFAFVFFLLGIPFLLKIGIQKANPIIQFLLFNVGIFIFLQIYLKAKAMDSGMKLRKSLEMMLVFASLDIWVPPMLLSISGVLSNEAVLSASGTDYLIGYLLISLGFRGFIVYALTYFLIPILFLFIASRLNGNFVRRI